MDLRFRTFNPVTDKYVTNLHRDPETSCNMGHKWLHSTGRHRWDALETTKATLCPWRKKVRLAAIYTFAQWTDPTHKFQVPVHIQPPTKELPPAPLQLLWSTLSLNDNKNNNFLPQNNLSGTVFQWKLLLRHCWTPFGPDSLTAAHTPDRFLSLTFFLPFFHFFFIFFFLFFLYTLLSLSGNSGFQSLTLKKV